MGPVAHRRSVVIVGLGLIGGSLALALRRAGWRVTGADRSRRAVAESLRRGVVRQGGLSLAGAVRGARLVVLCVPPRAIGPVLAAVSPAVTGEAVVTDVCGVKRTVLTLARRRLVSPARFVGAHPMAGSERSGIAAASPNLFRGRVCAITPVAGTRPEAVREVERMWRATGARPVRMSPAAHDRAVAVASHLPHLLAFALARAARPGLVRRLAAGSFRDATRVARSDPALWAQLLDMNRREIRSALGRLTRAAARLLRSPGRGGAALRAAASGLRGAAR